MEDDDYYLIIAMIEDAWDGESQAYHDALEADVLIYAELQRS